MTVGGYLLGVAFLAAGLTPVALGAWSLRKRLLPGWEGPPARTAEAIVALALVIGSAQLTGLVGLFRPLPVLVCLVLAGGLCWRLGRRGPRHEAVRPPAPPAPDAAVVVAAAACGVVVAAWSTRLFSALDKGMSSVDTLWYHLPVAARFVQSGSITPLHYLDPDPVTVFYPESSALLHAVGMLAFDSDFASVFLNMGFLALALLAAWSIGRPFGLAPLTLLGVTVVLATPALTTTQPGGAYNDVVVLALFLAAVAVLVNGGTRRAPVLLAALGVGLALGMKFTMAAPTLALTVGVLALADRRERVRLAALWAVVVAAAAGLWYARNLVEVGNPLPSADISLGPLSLPSPPVRLPILTISEFLTNEAVWRKIFLPGLADAFGPGWLAVVGLAAAGAVLCSLQGRDPTRRMLGLVALAIAVAFVFTPQFLGVPGNPFYFRVNLRYVAPGLALGLALLPLVPGLASKRARSAVMVALAAALLGTQLDPSIWPTELRDSRLEDPVRGAAVAAAAALGALVPCTVLGVRRLRRWRRLRLRPLYPVAALALLVVVGGYLVQDVYFRDRYTALAPVPRIWDWAQSQRDERIATVGVFLQYPLYGKELSNHVQYMGRRGPHGSFSPIRTCREWREALNAGRYRYVVTAPEGFPQVVQRPVATEATWTASDPAAKEILRDTPEDLGQVNLFRIDGRLDPAACEGERSAHRRDVVLRGEG